MCVCRDTRSRVQVSVQLHAPGMLSRIGDVQGSTMTPAFTQPDGIFFSFLFICPSNSLKHTIYISGSWLLFCFPCETKGETERKDYTYEETAREKQPYS